MIDTFKELVIDLKYNEYVNYKVSIYYKNSDLSKLNMSFIRVLFFLLNKYEIIYDELIQTELIKRKENKL